MSKRSHKTDPRSVYERIEARRQRKLAEQDGYREIIARAEAASDADTIRARLRELGWQGTLKVMSGLRFPPSHEDWKRWLGLDWEDVPQQRRLAALKDRELACRIYFYGEAAEHTERLKAMAVFAEAIGIGDTCSPKVFYFWSQRAILRELLPHARHLQPPGVCDLESLEATLKATDPIGEVLCEDADRVAANTRAALDRLMAEAEPEESR